MIVAYPSSLDTWTDCPRRYRFAYVERRPPTHRGGWAHTTLGAAVHVALARWWTMPEVHRTPAAVAAIVDEAWTDDGFADSAMSQRWRVRARAMVEQYVVAETARRMVLRDHDMVQPRRVETVVSLRASDSVALLGRPDRIDERPCADSSELVVVDYKTGRRPPDTQDARSSRTLAIYAAAAEATVGVPSTRVELHHLPTGRIVVGQHDRESRDRHVRRAVAVAEDCHRAETRLDETGASDELFPPMPSRLCAWCDYRDACPEGRDAGPAAAPWAALEPDSGAEHAREPRA